MKKLMFKITVPDKNNKNIVYEAGKTYDFEDERANEILAKRTRVTNEPFAIEYVEEPIEEVNEEPIKELEIIEGEDVVIEIPKPKKRKKNNDN